jgi:hypothetical protein
MRYRSELVEGKALSTLGVFVVDANHREQVCSRNLLHLQLCRQNLLGPVQQCKFQIASLNTKLPTDCFQNIVKSSCLMLVEEPISGVVHRHA